MLNGKQHSCQIQLKCTTVETVGHLADAKVSQRRAREPTEFEAILHHLRVHSTTAAQQTSISLRFVS